MKFNMQLLNTEVNDYFVFLSIKINRQEQNICKNILFATILYLAL